MNRSIYLFLGIFSLRLVFLFSGYFCKTKAFLTSFNGVINDELFTSYSCLSPTFTGLLSKWSPLSLIDQKKLTSVVETLQYRDNNEAPV